MALANLARAEQQRLLSERVARYAAGRVLEVASAVELIAFERPELSDRLQRARVNAQIRPVQAANGVLGVLGGLLAAPGRPAPCSSWRRRRSPPWWWPTSLCGGGRPGGAASSTTFEVVQTECDRRRSYLFGVLSRREEAAEVHSSGLAAHLGDRHTRLYDERIASLGQVLRRRLRLAAAGQLISSALAATALGALAWQVTTGRIGVATGAAAAGAMVVLGSRLGGLVSGARQLFEASLFLEDLTGFVGPAPLGAPGAARGEHAPQRSEALRVEGVSFRYPSRSEPSLSGASMEAHAGEVVALVGENGSGGRPWPRCSPGCTSPTKGPCAGTASTSPRSTPLSCAVRSR